MWCDSSCDWQGLSEIALQKLVEGRLGLRSEEQEGLRQERICSWQCCLRPSPVTVEASH